MNVPLKALEELGERVGVEVTDLNAFEFLHISQKAGFYQMYPKPNARRKSVPAQKPEVAPGGTLGRWEDLDMVMTKRGPKYTRHKPMQKTIRQSLKNSIELTNNKILALMQELKNRGIEVPMD